VLPTPGSTHTLGRTPELAEEYGVWGGGSPTKQKMERQPKMSYGWVEMMDNGKNFIENGLINVEEKNKKRWEDNRKYFETGSCWTPTPELDKMGKRVRLEEKIDRAKTEWKQEWQMILKEEKYGKEKMQN
jgi:exoribonuclease II